MASNATRPEQEAGYESAWSCIQAVIFAHGLPEAKVKAKTEMGRLIHAHPEGKRPTYIQGGIDAFKHFVARHACPKSAPGLDLGEPCL